MSGYNYGRVYAFARRNAKVRGIDFKLTREEFDQLVDDSRGSCQATDLPFRFEPVGFGRRRPFAPSLDRIIPEWGYYPGNCRLVCVIFNLAMNEWGIEPLHMLCRGVLANVDLIADDEHRARLVFDDWQETQAKREAA